MSDEPTAHYVDGYRPVKVDLSTLATFAKMLHDEVNLNFAPHAQRVIDTLDPGAGPLPPGDEFLELAATRGRYFDCRDTAISMLAKEQGIDFVPLARMPEPHTTDGVHLDSASYSIWEAALLSQARTICPRE